jgi:pimeloyl-ACP methyl ester carboxylesterase
VSEFIQAPNGQRIAVLVEHPKSLKGLAFVMHGLGGFKEQKHIETLAKVMQAHGYTTVRFDARNALGESDGDMMQVSMTQYNEDLRTVIDWASGQPWFSEPFGLAGHSMGGFAVTLYAEEHPGRVRWLIPFAGNVSGRYSRDRHAPDELELWERQGYLESVSRSKPGVVKRTPWSMAVDIMQYDALPKAGALTMSKLFIVGSKDVAVPVEQVRKLFEAVPEPKQLSIVPGAPHTFRTSEHLAALEKLVSSWLPTVS